ncbi:MAG TPA: CheB methylesterase domain-containing protein [Bacillales bacterium]|nr:CheB methylesterase domain-containing protein [Bacillales bacterium]
MSHFQTIVCIGASTGGPGALEKVLTGIPKHFAAPLFIVQHMPPKFTKALAARLDTLAQITVREAEHDELARAGTAYIAPGGIHFEIAQTTEGIRIRLDASRPKGLHCPSVNELLESAAGLESYKKIAVIMTGMGSDGTQGLRYLKKSHGTYAIAESEDSSVVYGMPRAAAATGAVDRILPVEAIAECLVGRVRLDGAMLEE